MLRRFIPSALTVSNLLSGSLGIYFLHLSDRWTAMYFLISALICDFFDGLLARLLKAETKIGKELDTLADMISFGLLPGFFIMLFFENVFFPYDNLVVGLFYVVLVALRLAMFNVDSESSDHFKGLPSPAAAIFVFSCLLFWENLFSFHVFLSLQFITSLLMIIPLPLESIKMKTRSSKVLFLLLAVIGILLVLWLKMKSFAVLVVLYYVLAVVMYQLRKKGWL